MKYSVNKDEFLTLDTLFSSSDSHLEPFNTSSYIHNTNYDTANPKKTEQSQYYSDIISLGEQKEIMTKKLIREILFDKFSPLFKHLNITDLHNYTSLIKSSLDKHFSFSKDSYFIKVKFINYYYYLLIIFPI